MEEGAGEDDKEVSPGELQNISPWFRLRESIPAPRGSGTDRHGYGERLETILKRCRIDHYII